MPKFLEDYSGLAAAGAGFQSFADAFERAKDGQAKRQEMEARSVADKAKMERDAFEHSLTQRKQKAIMDAAAHGQEPDFSETGEVTGTHYKPEYVQMQNDKANADPFGLKGLAADKAKQEALQAAKGFKLPPDKVLQVQSGAQIPKMLSDIKTSLKENAKLMGPVQGRIGAANSYDTQSQSVDAQFRSAAQTFGRYMEGGVLRKEDEEKYRKMFPNLSDTPEVAANKLAIVNKQLVDKQNADVQALRAQGYDTSGFGQLAPGELPDVLTGKKKKKGLVKPGGLVAPQGLVPGGAPPIDPQVDAKLKRLQELKAKAGQ